MNANTRHWLHKIAAVFIGGGAAALTSSGISTAIDPAKFNLATWSGLGHILLLVMGTFIISGITNVAFYLRQFPAPEEEPESTQPPQNQL